MEISAGRVYWITGLSGAGKTTIGKMLYKKIRKKKENIFFLDSDEGRKIFNDKCGYTREERLDGAYRNARVCKMIADQGIDVICSTISMFDEVRRWNRENVENYLEVYLEVPLNVLIQRDQKGLYSKVQRGECKDVAGMDLELDIPKMPDIKIINDGKMTPEDVVERILSS